MRSGEHPVIKHFNVPIGKHINIYCKRDACSVAQSCPTLCNPMDCSPPGSSVHGILQARILEKFTCPPPGYLPNPEIQPRSPVSPALAGRFFTTEPPGKSRKWDD